MLNWFKILLLLCMFGFLKELRPSEPFVTDYLIEPWRNITSEELNRYIFPIGTYSTVALLLILLLITDFLRYKPIVIAIGISGIITWSLLLFTTSFRWLQIIEVFYALYIATEVAYFTYIYAKVPKEHYLTVTSHSRAALLCGKFMSGAVGQTLIQTNLMNIRELNYITLVAQICATFVAFQLPAAEKSLYFNQAEKTAATSVENGNISKPYNRYKAAFKLISTQFYDAYSNPQVLMWSLWYAFGVCGYFQVWTYVQMLWTAIDADPNHIWNGAVDAIATLLCAGIALLASRFHTNVLKTQRKKIILLGMLSLCLSGAIFLMANTNSRYIAYGGYTLFYMVYTFTVTISSAEIAKHLPDDSYGLIFGINTTIALILQSTLTMIIVTDVFTLNFTIFQQFNVYGMYFFLLAVIYLIMIFY